MSQPFPDHPFLTGSFAPILFEADAYDLPVRGEIPRELRGTLYRNSPNPQFAPRDQNYHWFIGDGMVHAFHIADGPRSGLEMLHSPGCRSGVTASLEEFLFEARPSTPRS